MTPEELEDWIRNHPGEPLPELPLLGNASRARQQPSHSLADPKMQRALGAALLGRAQDEAESRQGMFPFGSSGWRYWAPASATALDPGYADDSPRELAGKLSAGDNIRAQGRLRSKGLSDRGEPITWLTRPVDPRKRVLPQAASNTEPVTLTSVASESDEPEDKPTPEPPAASPASQARSLADRILTPVATPVPPKPDAMSRGEVLRRMESGTLPKTDATMALMTNQPATMTRSQRQAARDLVADPGRFLMESSPVRQRLEDVSSQFAQLRDLQANPVTDEEREYANPPLTDNQRLARESGRLTKYGRSVRGDLIPDPSNRTAVDRYLSNTQPQRRLGNTEAEIRRNITLADALEGRRNRREQSADASEVAALRTRHLRGIEQDPSMPGGTFGKYATGGATANVMKGGSRVDVDDDRRIALDGPGALDTDKRTKYLAKLSQAEGREQPYESMEQVYAEQRRRAATSRQNQSEQQFVKSVAKADALQGREPRPDADETYLKIYNNIKNQGTRRSLGSALNGPTSGVPNGLTAAEAAEARQLYAREPTAQGKAAIVNAVNQVVASRADQNQFAQTEARKTRENAAADKLKREELDVEREKNRLNALSQNRIRAEENRSKAASYFAQAKQLADSGDATGAARFQQLGTLNQSQADGLDKDYEQLSKAPKRETVSSESPPQASLADLLAQRGSPSQKRKKLEMTKTATANEQAAKAASEQADSERVGQLNLQKVQANRKLIALENEADELAFEVGNTIPGGSKHQKLKSRLNQVYDEIHRLKGRGASRLAPGSMLTMPPSRPEF